jgi:replicative DNA helicase
MARHPDETGVLPHNIEAEQQLLGAILSSNDVLDRVEELVKPDHFFDPVHREIFQMIGRAHRQGAGHRRHHDEEFRRRYRGLKELGGAEYLVKLQLSAIATSAARDYAQLIHDLAVRRALIGLGATISDRARAMRDDISPDDQIVEAESDLFKLASTGKTSAGSNPSSPRCTRPSPPPMPPTSGRASSPVSPPG